MSTIPESLEKQVNDYIQKQIRNGLDTGVRRATKSMLERIATLEAKLERAERAQARPESSMASFLRHTEARMTRARSGVLPRNLWLQERIATLSRAFAERCQDSTLSFSDDPLLSQWSEEFLTRQAELAAIARRPLE